MTGSAGALAALAILAVVANAACGGDSQPIPGDEALEASRESLQAAGSVLVRTSIRAEYDGTSQTTDAEIGYESDQIAFEHYVTGDALMESDGIVEALLIPEYLYLRSGDGRWYVISPWDSDSIGELSGFSTDYDDLTADVTDLEWTERDNIDGETVLEYSGTFQMTDAPPGDIDLWLEEDTFRPRRLRLSIADGDASLSMVVEYVEYDRPIALPEPPADPRPWRDYELPDAPCTGDSLSTCLAAQTELEEIASDSCVGESKRVCLVPFGQVDPDVVLSLLEYYRDQYGLAITLLRPADVPRDMVDPIRGQVEASMFIEHMVSLFPEVRFDPEVVLVGLTPLDIYHAEETDWRFVFGVRGSLAEPHAIISTFRMNPQTYGLAADDRLLATRARKMLTKYIGVLYYVFPTSSDPESPLFNSILGLDDLDRMTEPLSMTPQ